MAKDLRINRDIKAVTVRLIDEGSQDVIPLEDALSTAQKVGLDLVEVAPNSDPPVCRVMDYGKYRYQQNKKLQDAKKSQTIIQVKEIRIRPKTEEHDLSTKIKHIKKFLSQGDKVKVAMMFRGREIAYTEIGRKMMEEIKAALEGISAIDQQPRLEGRNMIMIVAPPKKQV
ncbi:MAG: translation initiation factor IF-3 [Syntrophales bacterium]